MATISFILEKARHASELTPSEIKMIVDEIDRLVSRLEGCAQEVTRRDAAAEMAREQDSDRAVRLRLAEEDLSRVRAALDHEKQRRETQLVDRDERVALLTGMLRDLHYGLLEQPELSREELAQVITTEVTPWPKR